MLHIDGMSGDEIIEMAATALVVALEHEMETRALAFSKLPDMWKIPNEA
jgi:hypothetical protein